jgi:uncharacterized protein
MSFAPTASDAAVVAYIDSSAFTKIVLQEPESDDLRGYLRRTKLSLASSSLLLVETIRASRLVTAAGDARDELDAALEEVALISITDAIVRRARTLEPPLLRTLDALHLATALEIGVREVIVYDRPLAEAARLHGLDAVSPGA